MRTLGTALWSPIVSPAFRTAMSIAFSGRNSQLTYSNVEFGACTPYSPPSSSTLNADSPPMFGFEVSSDLSGLLPPHRCTRPRDACSRRWLGLVQGHSLSPRHTPYFSPTDIVYGRSATLYHSFICRILRIVIQVFPPKHSSS